MTASIPEPGPDSSSADILTRGERFAVNEVCQQVLNAWEFNNKSCDFVELMVQLNAGAARAVKLARELVKS